MGLGFLKSIPPASCFCDDIHTDAYIYYNEGEYYDADTRKPIKDMGEIENSPNNCISNSNSMYGYNASERYDYSPNHVPLSEFVPKIPTMFHNPQVNSQLAGLGNGLNGDPNDHDMDGSAAPPVGASPYNGSKSLVTTPTNRY